VALLQPTIDQIRRTAALLRIPLKDQGAVGPWELNPSQEDVAERLCDGRSVLVLKCRQEGVTSVCLLWLALLAALNPGQSFAVVLQDARKASDKLDILRGWLAQLGLGALEVSQASKVRLPGGAEIHALSARGGEAEGQETAIGRSGTYAAAILSEAAYYANDKALPAIKAAVGRGPLVIESTASGPDGFFAELVQVDETSFDLVFLGVEASGRCQMDPDSITDDEWALLQSAHGFTSRSHGAWWARELRDIGGDVLSMLREYPIRKEDPFRVSDSMWVQARPEAISPKRVTPSGLSMYAYREPDPMLARYVVTVDVSEGVGGDYSALWVIERGSQDVVAGWWSNTDETDVLADRVAEARALYSPDVVIIEKNGVGVSAVKEARNRGVPVLERTAGADKYAVLLAAKRYVEKRATVPELLSLEARSLRAKVGRLGRYQWIGRKDGLVALGQGLEWIRLNPWAPTPRLTEEEVYRAKAWADFAEDAYYS
jgi:hypothetical protein